MMIPSWPQIAFCSLNASPRVVLLLESKLFFWSMIESTAVLHVTCFCLSLCSNFEVLKVLTQYHTQALIYLFLVER